MERGAWTDDRLDDRFNHVDTEIAGLRADIRELRGEMRGLRAEIGDLRALTLRLYSGSLVAMVGLIAAVLARG